METVVKSGGKESTKVLNLSEFRQIRNYRIETTDNVRQEKIRIINK